MDLEIIKERYQLAKERLAGIEAELTQNSKMEDCFKEFFQKQAAWLLSMTEVYSKVEAGNFSVKELEARVKQNKDQAVEELLEENRAIYADVLPKAYERSFCNPVYAVSVFGKDFGEIITFLATELRSIIPYLFEQNLNSVLIRLELFLEVYTSFTTSYEESGKAPKKEEMKDVLYWYVSDYSETENLESVKGLVVSEGNFFTNIIETADLSIPAYLFSYGEFITKDEVRLSQFMAGLSQEKIDLMADTFTEGYRIGFEVSNKDLSKKKTVNIRYVAGFERMIKKSIENFRKMGLEPTIYRASVSVLNGRSVFKSGFYGSIANKQYEYDHKDDLALLYDKKLAQRFLEATKAAYEEYKEQAYTHAGPAVLEIFGEKPFDPMAKEENLHFDAEQQKIRVEYMGHKGKMVNEYIKGEERSFTIIAFPVPQIGDKFEEIFEEIIRVNTLDYKKYQKIQSCMIDALNECVYANVKGMNGNRTDLKVMLYPLKDTSKEAIFENCVADVNIPVGEVFTSPVLKGTEGLLHVSEVFLNELKYVDLSVWFKDGMISGYDCANFKEPKQNHNYIHENLLFNHETLPIGEFAIGTNTTAYMVGRKYGIQDKLPILIAEKTGPHFAVGDTCYSHAEEVRVYNPDGKEIVAKDNEVSLLRDTNPQEAYFNCHTDITIPYDELGELYGVKANGEKVKIIENGRFVLPGTEYLNKPFETEEKVL